MSTRTDDVYDDAYAEKAERDEREDKTREGRRERPVDLSSPGARSAMPLVATSKVAAGAGFESQPWDVGDDYAAGDMDRELAGATNADRADRPAAKRYRPSPGVLDMTTAGHGFGVERFSNPDRPEVCRYCGDRLLTPDETSPCEFPDIQIGVCFDGARMVSKTRVSVSRPRTIDGVFIRYTTPEPERFTIRRDYQPTPTRDRACECNGCRRQRMGSRKRGGQTIQCGKPECRSQLRREQNTRARRRQAERDRLLALDAVRAEPDRTDQDIAAELGIRPVRVREARDSIE